MQEDGKMKSMNTVVEVTILITELNNEGRISSVPSRLIEKMVQITPLNSVKNSRNYQSVEKMDVMSC